MKCISVLLTKYTDLFVVSLEKYGVMCTHLYVIQKSDSPQTILKYISEL